MKVLILGIDGFVGWTLALHLANKGHRIAGVDNFNRRKWVRNMQSQSITPILPMEERIKVFFKRFGYKLNFYHVNIINPLLLGDIFSREKPDCIVHFAEQPSAAYSMKDVKSCLETYKNNILGTLSVLWNVKKHCPKTHILHAGTMGVYSYDLPFIPEGNFEIEMDGKKLIIPYPKLGGSFYHTSKSCDAINLEFASKIWNLKITDVHQGIIYGIHSEEMNDDSLLTRLDVDESFGTVVHRFVAQAVSEIPLTLYGKGHQKRGFIPLCDAVQCFTLLLENPPKQNNYRVVNQFENVYTITHIANKVVQIANEFGINAKKLNIKNPRIELEDNYWYNPIHKELKKLGYRPSTTLEKEIRHLFRIMIKFKHRIKKEILIPKISWK
ncbi:NAD-dependent epimerase/dehydratase family protein [bacterium]|nr:NAD-dependent epimerase/dehydratase family protein [bacterium]